MSAPAVQNQGKIRTGDQKPLTFREERKMSAPVTRGQSELRVIYEKFLKVQEEIEMKLALQMTDVKTWLSKGLATKAPGKILGGLAVEITEGGIARMG